MRTTLTLLLLGFSLISFSQNRTATEATRENSKSNNLTGNNTINRSQQKKSTHQLVWEGIKRHNIAPNLSVDYLYFQGAIYPGGETELPYYLERTPLSDNSISELKARIINPVYEAFTDLNIANIKGADKIGPEITIHAGVSIERRVASAQVMFVPIRKNATTGRYEKLVGYDDIQITPTAFGTGYGTAKSTTTTSVLNTGNWYKVSVNADGLYKMDYAFLQSLGMDPASIDPRNIRVYGNGGGMLPQPNSTPRQDDLAENAIFVSGENDGSFDSGDYVVFYGQGPDRWEYDPSACGNFSHIKNVYSDNTYYFITASKGPGKRLSTRESLGQSETHTVNSFDDYAFHELDEENLIKSGREWFGEKFDLVKDYDFDFSFSNRETSKPLYVKTAAAARCITSATDFKIKVNNNQQPNLTIGNITGNYANDYAKTGSICHQLNLSSNSINVDVSYTPPLNCSDAVGWLNYIEVITSRKLTLAGSFVLFRDANSVGTGNIAAFNVANANSSLTIWDVTDPMNAIRQIYQLNGTTASFKMNSDELHEYVAFSGSNFPAPTVVGAIGNQNLHGLAQADMFIICHPDFLSEAERLAEFHRGQDEYALDVVIVKPENIYNEFSSGAQDVTAIRDFMKMFYDRATSIDDAPRYLLLFGDPSYDYKDRIVGNTNFVPTYESPNSLSPTSSYASDDYFGLLDDNEGAWTDLSTDGLDIGIGRFPVGTIDEARGIVDKILGYEGVAGNVVADACTDGTSNSVASADWRNIVCFIGDDEDNSMHASQANAIANYVDTAYPIYNVDKIIFDAYPQISTPGGQRFPGATEAINNRVQKGALIINYTGHGGEVGWAHERVLQVSDITSWTNNYRLPAFITATCEFSRFDDPERISAGEYVLLNSNGGGIALFTTTRLVYSAPNFALNKNFYYNVFEEENGKIAAMGDVIRKTKVMSGGIVNNRNFTLLGDPAQRLAYPVNKVVTTSINNKPITNIPDTLKALSLVTVSGEVHGRTGGKMSNFNGVLYPTVFDKPSDITTLGNDAGSPIITFHLQKNVLYKGKVSVTNGEFSFQFIVPKDIAYNLGPGKISYYAENGVTDANGYSRDVIIGGSDNNAESDDLGPEVALYLNDESFAFGGITNENPLLLARVSDDHGINTVGNGIGHDLTAVLDENTNNSYVLNDYYESDLDDYKQGTIKYPFNDLSEGRHTLKIKVWDVYNNSSEAYTEFVVAKSAELALEHVLNYPNPFTTNTKFFFEHNQPCDKLHVGIQVFTISGKLVKSINETIQTEGFRAEPIEWDGRDDYGQKIARGVYVYHLKVKNCSGATADAYERLVILN